MATIPEGMFPEERFHFEVLSMSNGTRFEADFNHNQWSKGGGHRLVHLMDKHQPFAQGTYSLRITREFGSRLNRRTETITDRPKWFEISPDGHTSGKPRPRINFLDCATHGLAC